MIEKIEHYLKKFTEIFFEFLEKMSGLLLYFTPRLFQAHFPALTEMNQYFGQSNFTMDKVNIALHGKIMSNLGLNVRDLHLQL